MFNVRTIARIISFLLLIMAGFMLIPLAFSLSYGDGDCKGFLISIICTLFFGFVFRWYGEKSDRLTKRDGYIIVSFGWLTLCVVASLPYFFSGEITSVSSAFFESTSGLTTTGATVFSDIESLPHGILFWRSLTQWIGGMGIIVLTVALFPLLGIGGVELFVAEAPGPRSDKIHPRIKETAKRLWFIYIGLTVLLFFILLLVGDMSFFDAINHAMTTMSTGGFSTKNASIGHFDSPFVQYPIILFMFIAGMNYTVIYFGLKGNLKRVWRSEEFKTYLTLFLLLALIVGFAVYYHTGQGMEKSFRAGAFHVISIITTTGYVSADYTGWCSWLTMLFFILLFFGACAGSTSGGIKIIRHLVFVKNTYAEFKRILHPRAVIRIKIDKELVPGTVLTHILVFLLIYLLLFLLSCVVLSIFLKDMPHPFLTTVGAAATCLGNVGPAIGAIGPVDNFSAIPETGKIILSFLMIVGRLELFSVLVLLTPHFWRAN